MNNRLALAFLFALLLSAAYGCKKKNDHTDVTFVNHIDRPITMDIYGSMDDYNENKNRIMRKVLQQNEVLVLTKEALPPNKTYYADWYDDNHFYNNWFNDASKPERAFVSFTPVPGNNTYYIEPDTKGNAKTVFLDKTGTRTNWKAVDAFQGSSQSSYVSVWDDLTENERVQEISIRKDFTALYSYMDAGVPTTKTYEFKVHNADAGYIELLNSNNSYLQAGFLPVSTKPGYVSNSTDSIVALVPGSTEDYYFMLVKQK
jgi:hypothetical protein